MGEETLCSRIRQTPVTAEAEGTGQKGLPTDVRSRPRLGRADELPPSQRCDDHKWPCAPAPGAQSWRDKSQAPGLVLPRFLHRSLRHSLHQMGLHTRRPCLSENHFKSLLILVLADVICCLYYLVKMLISQPQRGAAPVTASAPPLDMSKSSLNPGLVLPRLLHSSPIAEEARR